MNPAARVVLRPEVPEDLQGIVSYLDEHFSVHSPAPFLRWFSNSPFD